MIRENTGKFAIGRTLVTTAGTPVQMADLDVPGGYTAIIKALDGNTANVFLAISRTNAGNAATRFILRPGAAIEVSPRNLALFWVNATTNGEGVEYFIEGVLDA